MPNKVDVFSNHHAFHHLAAYVCHLGDCSHVSMIEHPFMHSVPALADGSSVEFKRGRSRCKATMTRLDRVVGTFDGLAVFRKLELVVPDYARFEDEAHEHWRQASKGKVQIFYSSYSNFSQTWEPAAVLPRRSMETIQADAATMKTLRSSMSSFLANEDEYVKAGRPYKLVAMLHGPPGTGKTSIVFSLLSEFKFEKVYVMSFGATMTDSNFLGLVHTMEPGKNALIMEDADTLVSNRSDKKGMSFTTMLNVLDGYLRPHGLVCFMTTNNLDVFDRAMTRSGRMDLLVEVGELDKKGARDFAARSLPQKLSAAKRKDIADIIVDITTNPSEISAFAFAHRKDGAEDLMRAARSIETRSNERAARAARKPRRRSKT